MGSNAGPRGSLNWKVTYRKGVYTIPVVCKQNFQTSHVNGKYSRSLVYNFFIGVRSQVRLKLKEQSTKIVNISCHNNLSDQLNHYCGIRDKLPSPHFARTTVHLKATV